MKTAIRGMIIIMFVVCMATLVGLSSVALSGREEEPDEAAYSTRPWGDIYAESFIEAEPNEPTESDEPTITFGLAPSPEQQAVLYFDAEEGKFKFEGDADLAAQRLFEMFQSAIDEYIREHCEPNDVELVLR